MKILVTGGNGLVGSAIKSLTKYYSEHEFSFVGRKHGDLTDSNIVNEIIARYDPDYVIHTAARVGGIGRNLATPYDQYLENILMNTHIIEACRYYGVEKLIAYSSVCVFDAKATVLREEFLQEGEPFPAHRSYAYAKRMVDIQIEACNKQYGTNYCSVIPGNIFGINDNFNLEDGHVVPSLIRKCYEAAFCGKNPFKVWGTGKAYREFVYAKDIARICLELLNLDTLPQRLLVSGEKEYTIKEIVEKICYQFDYDKSKIEWQTDKPDGQFRRPSSKSLFNLIFPDFKFTDIDVALEKTCNWFDNNYPDNVRM